MPTVRTRIARTALCWLALGLGLAGGLDVVPARADWSTCKFFSQLPDDCAGAEQRRYDHLRGARYEEIDLFAKDALKKIPYVSVYNTTGLNGAGNSSNSAPESSSTGWTRGRSPSSTKRSSPRRALPLLDDRLVRRPGRRRAQFRRTRRGVDGQHPGARQQARRQAGPSKRASAKLASPKPISEAYHSAFVGRTSIEGFKKGSEVYLLDDPKGRTWVMASYTDKNAPGLTLDKLASLGDVLTLPQGWKFRTAVLKKELILEPKGGSAGVIQDDKDNIYELTGPGQSNFVP